MNTEEKGKLTHIGKQEIFKGIIEKLTLGDILEDREKTYILSCAILFIRAYESDKRHISYLDFAYYIILKYSIAHGDYKPLYDFSVNFGFYPISKVILENQLVEKNIEDIFVDLQLEKFKKNEGYIETLEQSKKSKSFLGDLSQEKTYIAPTSFGKSSLIIDYIKKTNGQVKIGIIVPSKSLLAQTYNEIRKAKLGKKILIHNEMYNQEDSFVAIFTQERALRLLHKEDISFDFLIIDEAHNILKGGDSRAILLTRLLELNYKKNPHQKVMYLSPLVQSSENLRLRDNQDINAHTISFNIKEPEFFEYTTKGEMYSFNRFVNQYFPILNPDITGKHSYILENSKLKNFIYETSPQKIELFSQELVSVFPNTTSSERIEELQEILKREVHENFYAINALDVGVIYLHGKLPDLIKEYLEYKFRETPEIKYIIANTVILEGINLPIDTLFICNFYKLQGKELINLIGRVNRLNEIFTSRGSFLEKLIPQIHLINSKELKETGHNAKFKELRSRVFKDKVENPILNSFDIEKELKKISKGDKIRKRQEIIKIQENERFLSQVFNDEQSQVKQYFIRSGISESYEDLDDAVQNFLKNKNLYSLSEEDLVLDKIYHFFINGNLENIKSSEFKRLQNETARKYYKDYIFINLKQNLSQNIKYLYEVFEQRKKSDIENNRYMYFGGSYGKYIYDEEQNNFRIPNPQRGERGKYVKLLEKNKEELINLAIVKIKLEEDFISFTLSKFIEALFDFELITRDEYNIYIYGTTDQNKINLTKSGLNLSLISRLEESEQLHNLRIDDYNNIEGNEEFKVFLDSIDDFYRFEINRYIH